jgi:hypothetical protein
MDFCIRVVFLSWHRLDHSRTSWRARAIHSKRLLLAIGWRFVVLVVVLGVMFVLAALAVLWPLGLVGQGIKVVFGLK